MSWNVFFTTLLLHLCSAAALQAETVHLSVAASMTDACKEIITAYAVKQPETKVLPNFGASGALAKQIEQGAPADIFISASTEWVKYLLEKHLAGQEASRIFAFNSLVFVGSPKAADLDLNKLSTLDRIAIGNPNNVPAGQYAKQALEQAGVCAAHPQQMS